MSKPIVLLVCDTLLSNVVAEHGDYHVMFTTLLHASGTQLGIADIADKCRLEPYDVVTAMEYPTDEALDACQGILITGSKASAYEDIEWINKLVDFVARVAADKPTIKITGICFGHQIVGRALGGRCVKNDGKWEVGPTPIQLTSLGKDVFGTETLYIQEMHQDHVPEVPPDFHLLGSTSIAMNQGMVRFLGAATPASPISLDDIHIFTVQGHPEFTQGIVSKLTDARGKAGILTPEVVADATRRASWRNDGVTVIGKTILKIFGVI